MILTSAMISTSYWDYWLDLKWRITGGDRTRLLKIDDSTVLKYERYFEDVEWHSTESLQTFDGTSSLGFPSKVRISHAHRENLGL